MATVVLLEPPVRVDGESYVGPTRVLGVLAKQQVDAVKVFHLLCLTGLGHRRESQPEPEIKLLTMNIFFLHFSTSRYPLPDLSRLSFPH